MFLSCFVIKSGSLWEGSEGEIGMLNVLYKVTKDTNTKGAKQVPSKASLFCTVHLKPEKAIQCALHQTSSKGNTL